MLIILTLGLVIASVLMIFLKKNRESILLLGLCISLMIEISGVMLFIAKKGGISQEVVQFLYFSKTVQNQMQYFLITLNQLGYMIAIGRILFPLFLLEIALQYSMIPVIRKNRFWEKFIVVVPVTALIGYCPFVYRYLFDRWEGFQQIFANINLIWETVSSFV